MILTQTFTNSRVVKKNTRKLITKEIKADNVWFLPLQFSVTIPTFALSGMEINTLLVGC